MSMAADNNDPDITWRHSSGSEEGRQEKLDQKSVAEVVDAKMLLVAFFGQAGRHHEDTRVADEDIKTRGEQSEGRALRIDLKEERSHARKFIRIFGAIRCILSIISIPSFNLRHSM